MNNNYRPRGFGGFFTFPPVIKSLIIINVVVFFIQLISKSINFSDIPAWYIMDKWFALNPLSGVDFVGNPHNFQFWQLITYQFMHGDFMHILFNMFGVWMFGSSIEEVMGSKKFLIFYLLAGISAGLLQILVSPLIGTGSAVVVGASGSLFGLLVAYGLYFPDTLVFVSFLFPVKAKYFIVFYIVIQFLSLQGSSSGVAYLAHIGGALFGFLYIMFDKNSHISLKNALKKSYYYKSNPKKDIFSNPFSKNSHNSNDAEDAKYYDLNRKDDGEVSQADIDAILDKISQSGYQNLSEREKKILFQASKKMK